MKFFSKPGSSRHCWQPFQVLSTVLFVLAISTTASTLATDSTYRSSHGSTRLLLQSLKLPLKLCRMPAHSCVHHLPASSSCSSHVDCSSSTTRLSSAVSDMSLFATTDAAASHEQKPNNTDSIISANSHGSQSTDTTNSSSKLISNLKLIINLVLWYSISAYYNIHNKKALNTFQYPWLIATLQMATGIFLFVPMWLLKIRQAPFRNVQEFQAILSNMFYVGLFTTLSHISGVLSIGLGSISFVQVVKAAEPLFTALIGGIFLKDVLPLRAYLSMLPVVGGVVIASVSELSFSWVCLIAGLMSNLFAGARGVFGKKQMQSSATVSSTKEVKAMPKMSAANYYSMLTMLSFFMCLPVLLCIEGSKLVTLAHIVRTTGLTSLEKQGLRDALISGMLYYLYNEVSFQVLDHMSPVSHALANTIKRVAVIGLSVVVFHTPITRNGQIGSVIAILGALLYSLVNIKKKPKTS